MTTGTSRIPARRRRERLTDTAEALAKFLVEQRLAGTLISFTTPEPLPGPDGRVTTVAEWLEPVVAARPPRPGAARPTWPASARRVRRGVRATVARVPGPVKVVGGVAAAGLGYAVYQIITAAVTAATTTATAAGDWLYVHRMEIIGAVAFVVVAAAWLAATLFGTGGGCSGVHVRHKR